MNIGYTHSHNERWRAVRFAIVRYEL